MKRTGIICKKIFCSTATQLVCGGLSETLEKRKYFEVKLNIFEFSHGSKMQNPDWFMLIIFLKSPNSIS